MSRRPTAAVQRRPTAFLSSFWRREPPPRESETAIWPRSRRFRKRRPCKILDLLRELGRDSGPSTCGSLGDAGEKKRENAAAASAARCFESLLRLLVLLLQLHRHSALGLGLPQASDHLTSSFVLKSAIMSTVSAWRWLFEARSTGNQGGKAAL